MAINGVTLSGEKHDGKWRWDCPTWPDLATKYFDSEGSSEMVTEFTKRALVKSMSFQLFVSETLKLS